MILGLKVALIVVAVRNILLGLAFIIAPYQLTSLLGIGQVADYVLYYMGLLGISLIAPAVWLIAAARDPIQHITWVKFAILVNILGVVVQLYSILQGTVDFSQIWAGIILDAVFGVALLVMYPYRAARVS